MSRKYEATARRTSYQPGDVCARGHVLTPDNIYEFARPCGKGFRIYRSCLTCKQERCRKAQQRQRDKARAAREQGERRQCLRCKEWRPLTHFTMKKPDATTTRRLCDICRAASERKEAKKRRDEDGFLVRYLVGRIEAAHREGFTYREVAGRLGASYTSLINWKLGKTSPHHRDLVVYVERVRTDPFFDPPKEVPE